MLQVNLMGQRTCLTEQAMMTSGFTGRIQSCSLHLQGENNNKKKAKAQLEMTLSSVVSDNKKSFFQVRQQQEEVKGKHWSDTC